MLRIRRAKRVGVNRGGQNCNHPKDHCHDGHRRTQRHVLVDVRYEGDLTKKWGYVWLFYGVLRNSDVCVNLTKARPTCSPFESWDLNTKTNAIFSEIRRLLLIRSKPVQTRILRAGLLADNNSQLNTQLNVHLARGLAIHHQGRRALFILLLIATQF